MDIFEKTSVETDQSETISHSAVNYDYSQGNLDDIPHPDETSFEKIHKKKPLTQFLCPDDLELPPLPPDVSKTEYYNEPSTECKDVIQSLYDPSDNVLPAQIPLPKDFGFECAPLSKPDKKLDSSFSNDSSQTDKNSSNNDRYSPSKVDSDEDLHDLATAKPKVLGKEQAKKRLLAFSLSKQPPTAIKKHNKIAPSLKKEVKEKPPNPNKGSGVQDQFRATISEIEEEKRKMLQNMPNYLLLEMSDLAKSTHPIITSSLKLLEKHKTEGSSSSTKESAKKEMENLNKSNESAAEHSKESTKKDRHRSKSPSRNYRRSHSRSRDRKSSRRNRDSSKTRRRSKSKSPPKHSKDKKYKQEKKDSDLALKAQDLHKDWQSFKTSGFTGGSEIWNTITQLEENDKNKRKDFRRSPSPTCYRQDYKPSFNYLKRESKLMKSFQARSADSRTDSSALFLEKCIKFTNTKPMLIWSENPAVATSFYMSKAMLLDHCDSASADVLNFIIESNGSVNKDDLEVIKPLESRPWYSSNFLLPTSINLYDEFELGVSQGVEKALAKMKSATSASNESEESKKVMFAQRTEGSESELKLEEHKFDKRNHSRERRISLVNDSYLSDEEEKIKEMVVGDVKVQMNLDSNCVKVRSRWDSDYEDENSEEEVKTHKKVSVISKTEETEKEQVLARTSSNKMPLESSGNDQGSRHDHLMVEGPEKPESPGPNNSNDQAGNLASEYEEFLKMVSFDSNSAQPMENETISAEGLSKPDKEQVSMVEESPAKNSKLKFEMTDWDKESDKEDKSPEKSNYHKDDSEKDKSSLLIVNENKASLKKKKAKNVDDSKKKSEKTTKKESQIKKGMKGKKKRQSSSSSSYSSSDSYDSESDSDSDSEESRFFKKKKRKRVSKVKKKYKRQSSTSDSDSGSDSDSDSDDSKLKKKKIKKIKKRKSDSSETEEEKENVLLKQLDFKKQLIIKKIEEIDSISEKSVKKKVKEGKQKKKEKANSDDSDFVEKRKKSIKKKKTDSKGDKKKKKKYSPKPAKSSKESRKKESSSESSEEKHETKGKIKKKSEKLEGKRKKNVSESSDSDSGKCHKKSDKLPGIKSLKSIKKMKKTKKIKKKKYSSSDSESEDSSSSEKKNPKKKDLKSKEIDENTSSSWKDSFLLNDTFKSDHSRLEFEKEDTDWKISTKKEGEKVKEKMTKDDDWEASSSSAESAPRSKSRESWDDEVPSKEVKVEVLIETSNKTDMSIMAEKGSVGKNIVNRTDEETLQSSNNTKPFSSVSFNENSLCSFGPELSRNFFLSKPDSDIITGSANLHSYSVESRPFHSVTKDNFERKPDKSELYSPGHSDSDASDVCANKNSSGHTRSCKEEKYDPLNSESDTSVENEEAEVNKIPLPGVPDISLPSKDKAKDLEFHLTPQNNYPRSPGLQESIAESSPVVSFSLSHIAQGSPKTKFASVEFSPSAFNDAEKGSVKKQIISMKSQPKLKSKAASVFQDDSDDDASYSGEMAKEFEKHSEKATEELEKNKANESDEKDSGKLKESDEILRKRKKSSDRHDCKEQKKRSSSRERKGSSSKTTRSKISSPHGRRKSKTPEPVPKSASKEKKREIRSDSFEIEPLKSAAEYEEVEKSVQPIPVLTGLSTISSEQHAWTRSHFLGYTSSGASNSLSGDLLDPSESFDIYPSDDSKFRNRNFDKTSNERFDDSTDKSSSDKSAPKDDKKKKSKRRSRSRSTTPRKRRRSKSPERRKSPRNRSPRRRSKSPKRRDKSPYSPRRKSPKRKSPSRRYRSSRSPDRRRKSRSRSPRKRRTSPSRRSHSLSPRKHRSPKRRDSPRRRTSPSRGYSPRKSLSPRRDIHYPHHYSNSYHNRIPVIGAPNENIDRDLNPSKIGFSRHEHPLSELDMNNSYYNREYAGEFGSINYSEEVGGNNLITVKNHDLEKPNSPERLSLDQRIELELGVPMGSHGQGDQYHKAPFQDINSGHYPNSMCCENSAPASDNFYANHNSDFNSQYYNGHPSAQPGYGSFQQYSSSQNSMLQVGNIVEVVPTMQHSHPPPSGATKNSSNQIMQVGNVLQVVPAQKNSQSSPMAFHGMQGYAGPPSNASPVPPIKTQKATAVVAPSSIIPQPNPEALINPLIKAIQLEREKRKKEKEKRKAEREERRKARQLRREAKLMSVNEKLKKSVQDEGLMLGQEVEDDELMDALDLPSPPIPVEIITVTSPSALPPAGKGILITAGFMPKPPSEKKEVKFADGVLPGEGTSSSGDEDVATPPPKPKLPKEKRYKKKKTKVKKKVKVQIIRQIIEHEEDDEEDPLSPPPPPPGDPPPIYFARFPFLAGDAQFPVYHTQTTTTTVQYPAQSF